jgi:hypothetical protein
MKIQKHKNNTDYNFDLTDSSQSIEDCMDLFIEHHELVPLTKTTLNVIKKASKIWKYNNLKKCQKYAVMYKPETDTIFVPFIDSDNNTFTLLELNDYKQFLHYKTTLDRLDIKPQ